MKALYNITYGLYILTAKNKKANGCIINTLMQVTSEPTQISITVNKNNYTTQLIKETGKFNVSLLDETTSFDTIKHFGFASGKDTDKFANFENYEIAKNGIPYITKHTNSYLSAKVVSSTDVGTHITFVAEVVDDAVLNNNAPVTYAYYLNHIKPKQKNVQKNSYVCRICGYVHEADTLPSDFVCPICKHGATDFEQKQTNTTSNPKAKTTKTYTCPICGYSETSTEPVEKCIICGAPMSEKVD